ncbi:hypothetical protein FHR50_000456 [Xanthomonas arboricola]|nr:hypothetical protein [Xanthomonas campestris pv. esculenti]
MANISRRRTGELTRALFHILKTQPEGMRASDALASLESRSCSPSTNRRLQTQFRRGISGGVEQLAQAVYESEQAIYDQNELKQA